MIVTADKLKLYRVDCRTVRLLDPKFIEIAGENSKEIIKLQRLETDTSIEIGNVIRFGKDIHKVNIILKGLVEGRVYCYDLKCAIPTISTLFVTPLLGFTSKNDMFWGSLVNAFMSTPKYDVSIALLYKFDGSVEFGKYETLLTNHKEFIERTDPDPYHSLYVFNVPSHFQSAYDLIRAGKYSEVDGLCKLCILDFHNFSSTGHTGKILYKDPTLKQELEERLGVSLGDVELHSVPDMQFERYDEEYYRTIKKLK